MLKLYETSSTREHTEAGQRLHRDGLCDTQKNQFARENLRRLRATVCLAQEMARHLGRGHRLL
jgi:hypothetical protein